MEPSDLPQSTSASTAAKLLPLRLCEVLEKEFVAIHGMRPARPGWLLDAANVDFARLIDKLRAPGDGSLTQAVDAIGKKLTGAGVKIDGLRSGASDGVLLAALNGLVANREDLYDPTILPRDSHARRLAHIRFTDGGQMQPLGADEQTQLNRLLLEEAFPADVLARIDTLRLARSEERRVGKECRL